jgi:transmembrane sensor
MNQFQTLLDKYLNRTINDPEKRELAQMLEQPDYQIQLAAFIDENFQKDNLIESVPEPQTETIYQNILAVTQQPAIVTKVVPINKPYSILRWAIAAAIIIVIGTIAYFSFTPNTNSEKLAQLPQSQRFRNDISPAKGGIILTRADGTTTILDTMTNGSVMIQGTSKAIKGNGTISYTQGKSAEVVYNSVATQKGNTFHLQLADGTEVWLDAVSSIHFPTSFPGKERVVEVTGQAYFEVAKNPNQPFRVKSGNQEIEVLGTHFNINSFNAQQVETTLLEGSVKVSSGGQSQTVILKPGEQSTSGNNGTIQTKADPDMDEIMAWKNGRFHFNGNSMEEIMAQLSRWYDIDVEYKDRINEIFVADLQRDIPVSRLLELLEMTKQVTFSIDGKKVTVMK